MSHPCDPDPGGECWRPGDFTAGRRRARGAGLRRPQPFLLSSIVLLRGAAEHQLLRAEPSRNSFGVPALSLDARGEHSAAATRRYPDISALWQRHRGRRCKTGEPCTRDRQPGLGAFDDDWVAPRRLFWDVTPG